MPPDHLACLPESEALVDLELATRFSWPPTVSDQQPPDRIDWLLAIAQARDEILRR